MYNSFILQQYIGYTTLLNMLEQHAAHHQEEQLCPLPNRILYGCLQRVTIPEAVVIQLVLLMMSSVLLETC